MIVELFKYEITDPADANKRVRPTVWWIDKKIMIVCDTMENLHFDIIPFTRHLRNIGFSELTIVIVRQILVGLSQFEETLP